MSLTRRELLRAGGAGAIGLGSLGAVGAAVSARGRDEAPNAVVIVIDSLRRDHVGAYGAGSARTPAIDALARQSIRFTRARPEAFPTVAARRAILTGRRAFPFRDWQAEEGLPRQPGWMAIPEDRPTFLDVLGAAGWKTGYVTDNPWILTPAWDRFRSSVTLAEGVPGQIPLRRPPRGRVSDAELRRKLPPQFIGSPHERRIRDYLAANRSRGGEEDYAAARVFRAAERWLDALDGDEPFALVVDSFDPHEPWDPPPRYVSMYGPRRPPGGIEPIQPFGAPGQSVGALGLPEETVARARQLYAAEVTHTDAWLGRFLDSLDDRGLADDTLVVLLSDHGVLLGEHDFMGKTASKAYREIYDVPFLLRAPDGRRAGTTSEFFASTHDVAPTVLAALGVTAPGLIDGEDLTVLLDGASPPERDWFTASYGDRVIAGDGRWLLLADNQGSVRELYDTRRDPEELHDVAAVRPDVGNRLWANLLADAGGTMPTFGDGGVTG